jgi:Protein of unknown function (DUF2905)
MSPLTRQATALDCRLMGLGRGLIVVGLLLVGAGLVVTFGGRLPIRLGRLPGDISIHGRNSSFYFPIATCILLSVLLSLVLWILRR